MNTVIEEAHASCLFTESRKATTDSSYSLGASSVHELMQTLNKDVDVTNDDRPVSLECDPWHTVNSL